MCIAKLKPQRGDMFIEYQLPNPSKAPAGRHVCRVGLMHDKSSGKPYSSYSKPDRLSNLNLTISSSCRVWKLDLRSTSTWFGLEPQI